MFRTGVAPRSLSRTCSLGALGLLCGVVACSLPPSEECSAFVACQEAIDASVDVTDYQEGGRCWASPRPAARCTEQCEVALRAFAQLASVPAACEDALARAQASLAPQNDAQGESAEGAP